MGASKIVKNHDQGLFGQLGKSANKHIYKSKVTQEDMDNILKSMYEKGKRQIGASVATTQRIAEEMTKLAAQDQESKILEKLLEILSTLYIDNTITAKRYGELERLLFSDDKESQVLAGQIIKSLYKKEIVI